MQIINMHEAKTRLSMHAAAVASLPDLHRDPFDRMLVAQAISEAITLVSSDRAVLQYPGPILATDGLMVHRQIAGSIIKAWALGLAPRRPGLNPAPGTRRWTT